MNILTFDIEEWFHILDNSETKTEKEWSGFESRIHSNMNRIFKILEGKNLKATFFCLGWIADKYPDVIKQIDSKGYEIATHSNEHQLVYEMSPEKFENDLRVSIDTIENIIGKKVETYRAPGFSITNNTLWAFEILHKLGIKNDCSIFPANRAHGGISNFSEKKPCIISYNGIQLKEFPINTSKVFGKDIIFSGGGYFRLIPYPLLKSMTKKADYVMTYFHPRDFDAEQPLIEGLNTIRRFKSYYGLAGCEQKLLKWLNDFEFTDLMTFNNQYDWESAKTIDLAKFDK